MADFKEDEAVGRPDNPPAANPTDAVRFSDEERADYERFGAVPEPESPYGVDEVEGEHGPKSESEGDKDDDKDDEKKEEKKEEPSKPVTPPTPPTAKG